MSIPGYRADWHCRKNDYYYLIIFRGRIFTYTSRSSFYPVPEADHWKCCPINLFTRDGENDPTTDDSLDVLSNTKIIMVSWFL